MALINISGEIVTAGIAQTLSASSDSRRGFMVQNLSADDLWVNEGGTTAAPSRPSIKIIAGALYESPYNIPCPYEISIYGATAGQSFTAREW